MSLSTIEEAVAALRGGDFVVVADDEDRENEGDLILAAEHATEETIAFLLRHTSGIVCAALEKSVAEYLDLAPMVSTNTEAMGTAFTVSVDARVGTTTGISSADRATTLRALAAARTRADDLRRPGHVFPLVARPGGVLKRAGHTEAAVDLTRLAGCIPVGVLCEIMSEDRRSVLRRVDLESFAIKHRLPMITIADLIRHRRTHERLVEHVSEARVPTSAGVMTCHVYRSLLDGIEHLALVSGDVRGQKNVLVRVHSECLTGDVFRSLRCDCGPQLEIALARVALETGVVVYLRGHEGRGIGLGHKIRAYALQDEGRDTVEANVDLGLPIDSREYGVGAQILADLGLTSIRVLSNNPGKFGGLEGFGLSIVERVPLIVPSNPENVRYLETKRAKLQHSLPLASTIVKAGE